MSRVPLADFEPALKKHLEELWGGTPPNLYKQLANHPKVITAWNNFAKKYPALRSYSPATARFESAKGTVYRLSVQGFASDDAARDFCASLKRAGGNCFVRTVAGDAPVRLAAL